jgi:hypothetical protein
MKNKVFFLATLAIWFQLAPCEAGQDKWIHTLYFDNDYFSGTDAYYTSGIKYSIISPNLTPDSPEGSLPRRVLEFIHALPFCTRSQPDYTHKVEFSVAQEIYTPKNTDKTELIRDDRPYAGWSYLSTGYHRRNDSTGTTSRMDTVELQLGVIGPLSFAEEAQKFMHRITATNAPNGWDNQLDNEPGLAVIFERKWLLHPAEENSYGYSTMAHAGAAMGNVYTYGNLGMEFRFGWNIQKDFGVSLVRPAGSTRLEIGDDFSAYLFGAVNGKAVARDIFLDGNTFGHSHSIDKKFFVANLAGGLAVSFNRFIATWTMVLRSKEFEGQKNEHRFGSIALSFSFPLGVH